MIRAEYSVRRGEAAAALRRDGYVVVCGTLSDLLVSELMAAAETASAIRGAASTRAPQSSTTGPASRAG